MNIESFRKNCMERPGVEETLPFGPDTLVYKVMGKAFALTGLDDETFRVNLKCDPEKAIELRENHPGLIIPGWHMNKKHWNTVIIDGSVEDKLIHAWIDHSYELVVASLDRKHRDMMNSA